jgi:ribosome maturation factor RimP
VAVSRDDRLGEVRSAAERVARGYGLEIFDVQLRRESIGWVLRVVLDRPVAAAAHNQDTGISVSECQRVSQDLSAILDAEITFDWPYTLEVSSPGLDRPLRSLGDCRRFTGRLAKLVTSQPVDRQQHLTGRITGVDDDAVILRDGARVHRIPWTIVTRARLDVEF